MCMFSSDAILQTVGSILGTMLGAFLGGYYAVHVMKKQIDFQKNLLEQDKKEKFQKTYWLIKVGFEVLGDAMVSTSKTLSDPATGDKPNYGYILGKLDSCLDQAYLKISEINSDYIPHEIYKSYLGGKTLMDGSKLIISRMSKRYFETREIENER